VILTARWGDVKRNAPKTVMQDAQVFFCFLFDLFFLTVGLALTHLWQPG
jgi:hypothetical protein